MSSIESQHHGLSALILNNYIQLSITKIGVNQQMYGRLWYSFHFCEHTEKFHTKNSGLWFLHKNHRGKFFGSIFSMAKQSLELVVGQSTTSISLMDFEGNIRRKISQNYSKAKWFHEENHSIKDRIKHWSYLLYLKNLKFF